ncbi:MAG TPA: GvpL/GvpF family gas vesicle protein [Chloroflexota bacterium]|nr:GvpL/GvpF family gas vesicle protein [Chloroflexota bacterium]
MLYAYGAVRAGAAAPAIPGIDGTPVTVLEAGGLGVAVSELPAAVEPTPRRLAEHHGVLMELLRAGGGVVPFRFGNMFGGQAELQQAIEARAPELRQKLEELAGCVEMALQVLLDTNGQILSGTDYLRTKQRQFRTGDELRNRVDDLVKDWRQEVRSGTLKAACLLPEDRVPELRARLAQLDPRPRISGPWPPSSFV